MRLPVYGDRLITDLQSQFASVYPFLKIEFFKSGGSRQQFYSGNRQIAHHLPLKDARSKDIAGDDLVIDDKMTVHDLENAFMDRFGLTAQVFRRSGNIWLETSITNNWTLKQQNDHGREITVGKMQDDKD